MRVIFRLTVDLTDAERYRDAYHKLLDEVGVLAARNQLAESEANRLSQFNAEILGHTNPSQRIVYLDRVRRELAETKQVRCVFVGVWNTTPNV
jgi:heme oxygenase